MSTSFSASCNQWTFLRLVERWRSRLRTAEAVAALCAARMLVRAVRFDRWRPSLGLAEGDCVRPGEAGPERLADHVEWAARLVPFPTKCLPRAMALSWMLRSRKIGHTVVFAVRPEGSRMSNDHLHAWVEVAGDIILGNLPGPWVLTLRLGSGNPERN